MRRLLIGLVVLGLVLGVSVGTVCAVWTENGNKTITVKLLIASETWIQYQDDSWATATSPEPDIMFSTATGNSAGADPWRPEGLIGIYDYDSTKAPTDAYATGWYESTDGATIYLKSNIDLSGVVQCSGPLTNAASDTLPSWFTVAVTGYDEVTPQPDPNGFRLANSQSTTGWVNDGTPPGAVSPGGYGGDNTAGGQEVTGPMTIKFGNQGFWPSQDAFKMINVNYSLNMDAPVGPGTMKFLGRVKRNGMADVAGQYTATLWVDFNPT